MRGPRPQLGAMFKYVYCSCGKHIPRKVAKATGVPNSGHERPGGVVEKDDYRTTRFSANRWQENGKSEVCCGVV